MTRAKHIWFGLGLSLIGLGACVDSPADEEVGVTEEEIVGGTSTTVAANPWQVALTSTGGSQFCGGSIVGASWVLTAQHCVAGGNSNMRVVAGITRLSQQSSGQIRTIDAVAQFPGYSDPTTGEDVSLVHLATPLDLSGANARAIPLVTPTDAGNGATAAGVTATVTGWGALREGGAGSDVLQTVNVPIVANDVASQLYGLTITSDQVAAGPLAGGRDSCQGDSGGPFTVQVNGTTKLAGAVSWGEGCARANFPGLYARVSSFHDWVSQRTGGSFSTPLALTGLSGQRNNFNHRSVSVPAGAKTLSIVVRGGSGDADLYVRRDSQPTTSQYTCRPYLNGNSEFCTINAPQAGTWFVSLRAFSNYSGVSLTASIVQ